MKEILLLPPAPPEVMEEILEAVYDPLPDLDNVISQYDPSSCFLLRWTLNEIHDDIRRAAEISREDAGELWFQLIALQSAIAPRLLSAPASNLKLVEKDDDLLTPAEAARMLGTTVKWLYAHKHQLPHTKLSHKQLRFSRKSLQRYIAARVNRGA
jgi:hypothetical protein